MEGEQSTGGFVDDIRLPDGGRLLARVRPDGTVHRFHDDGRGNIIAVTDQTGTVVAEYRYTPYGRDAGTTGTIDNPYRFQGASGGHTEGGTGLIHLGHRTYDPTYGMFTSRDPMHSSTNRMQQNPYLYAGGDPINHVDPTGLAPQWMENLGARAAGAVNAAYGAFKVQAGALASLAGTAALPFGATTLHGLAAQGYGAYQVATGAARFARGVRQLQGSADNCPPTVALSIS